MTPVDVRTLADRTLDDRRYGRLARSTCAAVLEAVAARMERGDW